MHNQISKTRVLKKKNNHDNNIIKMPLITKCNIAYCTYNFLLCIRQTVQTITVCK